MFLIYLATQTFACYLLYFDFSKLFSLFFFCCCSICFCLSHKDSLKINTEEKGLPVSNKA